MKAGWDLRLLSEVSALSYGYTESAQVEPVGPRFLRITDIRDNGVDWDTVPYCKIDPATAGKYALEDGDIVFARTGATTGKSFIITKPPRSVFASYLIRLRPISKNLIPRYLHLYLQSPAYWKAIQSGISGSAQGGFNATKLGSLNVPIPPVTEQRRIVGILDEAFAGLDAMRANAQTCLENCRALINSALATMLDNCDEAWNSTSVAQLVERGILAKPFDGNHGEIHPKRADYVPSGVPFIMAADLHEGAVDTVNCKFITHQLAKKLRVGFAKDGDILISHKGTIGRTAILRTNDEYVILTPQLTAYRILNKEIIDPRFLYVFFNAEAFQNEFYSAAEGGSTRAYVGITKQLALHVKYPSLMQQRRFVSAYETMTSDAGRLVSNYLQKSFAIDELRMSLLHQAFSGNL